jgi:transcriptional regulator with XRE-family HTH domain
MIRRRLGLSQTMMCKALELDVNYSVISNYELGTREPPLPILLKYARLAGVSTDLLIDDDMDLPDMLPLPRKAEDITPVKRAGKRR